MQVCLPLRRAIWRSSETQIKSVVSLEDNVDVFSPVCVLKIEITEDVGLGVPEVCLIKTLVSSPNRLGSTGSTCTNDNVFRFISTDDGVCTTDRSWIRTNMLSSLDSKEKGPLLNLHLDSKNVTSTETSKQFSEK